MVWTPRTTVAAVIERDNRFLMVEEETGTHDSVLNQPAGHLEDNESLVDAVVREVLEETTWLFSPQALVGIYKWQVPETGRTYVRYCYTGPALKEEPNRVLDEGIIAAHWFDKDEIEAMSHKHRSPMVMRCLSDYLAGTRYPLELINEIT